MNTYATDGKCHNATRGTFGHECGKPATFIGTNRRTGFRSGYCAHCKEYGDEAQYCDADLWVCIAEPKASAYNAEAVNKAIAASNRAGRRISRNEGNAIHALLKGRHR